MKNSKGTVMDLMYLTLVFLVVGIMILVAMYAADQIFPELESTFGNGTASEVVHTSEQAFGTLDYIFLFVYFALCATPIFFAVLVRNHPIFFVVNLIVIVVFFLILPALSNVMYEFWSMDEFAVYAYGGGGTFTFPIMTRIFQYLPLITISISVILMIAMFSKRTTSI